MHAIMYLHGCTQAQLPLPTVSLLLPTSQLTPSLIHDYLSLGNGQNVSERMGKSMTNSFELYLWTQDHTLVTQLGFLPRKCNTQQSMGLIIIWSCNSRWTLYLHMYICTHNLKKVYVQKTRVEEIWQIRQYLWRQRGRRSFGSRPCIRTWFW